jgi:histidine triad (HIT) family protein
MNCIFCKIINNEIPSYTIFEDDYTKVFLDINPDSNGHMLVVPKQHFVDIKDIDSASLNNIMNTVKKMVLLIEDRLNCDGITLIQNNGISQDVKHFHLHIKPLYNNPVKMDIKEIYEKLK